MIDWTEIQPGRANGEMVGDFNPGIIFLNLGRTFSGAFIKIYLFDFADKTAVNLLNNLSINFFFFSFKKDFGLTIITASDS